MDITQLGFIGITSLMLSMLLMPFAIKLAKVVKAIDVPVDRSVHEEPIPRFGGVAIAISFLITCLLFIPVGSELNAFLLGLVIILLTGLADDIWEISSSMKFAGQIAACLVFIYFSGAAIDSFGDLFGTGPIETGVLAIPLTVFCMVGVINALNLSDGLDGLAGGLSVIACLFLAYFAIISGHWLNLALVTALVGSLIGFLYYNSHPAKIFMGDTGSLVLGYAISAICILFEDVADTTLVMPISLALIMGLPIHDTFLVMTRRVVHGHSPFSADSTHLHHRLINLGLSHPAVVTVMYIAMFSYGVLALIMQSLPEWQQFAIGMSYGAVLFGSVIILHRMGFRVRHEWELKKSRLHGTELYIRITEIMGKSTRMMSLLIPVALVTPLLFFPSIQSGFLYSSFIVSFAIIVLFPWKASSEYVVWTHGLIYIATFTLLVILNLIGPRWTAEYLTVFSILLSLWVLMKLIFNRRKVRALITSGFELLMLTIAWFIPVVLMNVLEFSFEKKQLILHACLQAIPFLLAMKFISHREPKRNRTLILCLAGIFFMIGLRQIYVLIH
jgi:UDP-GlcNAc:undecaprenyl-phosphate/decaprenyl-phosphate GlcNAc-1-phosphate transferase